MSWTLIMLCFWSASAALGAFLVLVLRPKLHELAELGRKERERIWECLDRVAQRRGSLRLLGALVTQEQRAFEQLNGAADLEALERSCPEYQNSRFLLVALEVDMGMLEAELELVKGRRGRFFYYCFLRSTGLSANRMIRSVRAQKSELLACPLSPAGKSEAIR